MAMPDEEEHLSTHSTPQQRHTSSTVQAAAAQAPQLSAEEARKLRQERDPNFGAKDRKRKQGLGFQEPQEAKRPKPAQVQWGMNAAQWTLGSRQLLARHQNVWGGWGGNLEGLAHR